MSLIHGRGDNHACVASHGDMFAEMIAVRLNILTRKTLGGLRINLNSQVLDEKGDPIPACMPPGKWPVSAAATMATTPWKAPFSAAVFFPAGMPAHTYRRK